MANPRTPSLSRKPTDTKHIATNTDIRDIFQNAVKTRKWDAGKMVPFAGKKGITLMDLSQAWEKRGEPHDIRDIATMLKKDFKFSDNTINKVFAKSFGSSDNEQGYETPTASPAVQQIADFAKKNGIEQDLITWMKEEFGVELGLTPKTMLGKMAKGAVTGIKKAFSEEIKDVFAEIILEDRKEKERETLGRSKK